MDAALRDLAHGIGSPLSKVRQGALAPIERRWPSVPFDEVFEVLADEDRSDRFGSQASYNPVGYRQRDFFAQSIVPVLVEPRLGMVFSDSKIVWGSSDAPDLERDINFLSLMAPKRKKPCAILAGGSQSGSYFNLFNDFLVKAIAADAWGLNATIPLMVTPEIAQSQAFKEIYRFGFFGNRDLVFPKKGKVVALDSAYLVRPPSLDRERFDEIARRLLGHEAPAKKRRILVESSSLGVPAIQNLAALDPVLEMFDIERVILDELPLFDQFSLFRDAELIVAVHSEPLVNLLFTQSPCALLELFPSALHPNGVFEAMCEQRGHAYARVAAQSGIGKGARTPVAVDPETLRHALEQVISG